MKTKSYKMVHVPMTAEFYALIKSEAAQLHTSVAQLSRQAILDWIQDRQKQHTFQQVHDYAQNNAGVTDLDHSLESIAVEHLLETLS